MRLLVLLLLTLLGAPAVATEVPALAPGLVNPGYEEKPPWFKESFLDIREDVAAAEDAGKRVLLYFYQDGCPYCRKLLSENFAVPEIVDKTRAGFDVIAINMWGDREVTDLAGEATTEKKFAADLKVMFTPTMLFLDEAGQVVLRVNGYYHPAKFEAALDYVSGHMEDEGPFGEYLAARTPEAGSAAINRHPRAMEPPLKLKADFRGGDKAKPLLVLFERPHCPVCDELHEDILQRPATRRQLERFDLAQVNVESDRPLVTPRGMFMATSHWADELDIKYTPSMVFFDAAGREVFRTEAYLRSFHVQSAMDYAASGAYADQPSFQRFISARADALEAEGIHVDLMD